MMRNLDTLRFSIDDEYPDILGECLVKDSPHYQYVCGNKQPYMEWQSNREKDVALKTEKFDRLIKSIKREGLKKSIYVRGSIILDGHHRAAVCMALGYKEIECLER